jgi:UDP-N-acetylglucosamine--N-acetylmuramyl-(pentapeptide) pyrophosphoryl-undecaprenol N-acetylglucosamine transferase
MGGSQGARAINELVLGMASAGPETGTAMHFLLQTGARDFSSVADAVREKGLPVEPFPFTDRIGEVFSRCHAVLMRAGALSIAEAALFGRPCVLIPYPFAADRHQDRNAEEFCVGGGGVWMRQDEASVERVRNALARWAGDPVLWKEAGEKAARFSRPDAAAATIRGALREMGRGADEGV